MDYLYYHYIKNNNFISNCRGKGPKLYIRP